MTAVTSVTRDLRIAHYQLRRLVNLARWRETRSIPLLRSCAEDHLSDSVTLLVGWVAYLYTALLTCKHGP